MSSKRKKNMDELLKDYAQKRQSEAGPPLEVPPAARKLLQSEVARTFPKPADSRPWIGFLAQFWPRLAVAGSVCAVLVAGLAVWLRQDEPKLARLELAQNEARKPLSPPIPESTPTVRQAMEAESLARKDESSRALKEGGAAARPTEPSPVSMTNPAIQNRLATDFDVPKAEAVVPSPSAPQPDRKATSTRAATPAPKAGALPNAANNPSLSADSSVRSDKLTFARKAETNLESAPVNLRQAGNTQAQPEATISRANLEKLRLSTTTTPNLAATSSTLKSNQPPGNQIVNGEVGPGNATRLHFSQADPRARYRRNFNSPPVPNILPTFEMQRDGGNIRVIDADGSIYEGILQVPAQNTRGDSTPIPLAKGPQVPGQAPTRSEERVAPTANYANAVSHQAGNAESESFFFRAVGTNRSLNQKVVFTGNFEAASNLIGNVGNLVGGGSQAFPVMQSTNSMISNYALRFDNSSVATGGIASVTSNAAAQQLLQNQSTIQSLGRIEGKAIIAGTNELRIEALRVQP